MDRDTERLHEAREDIDRTLQRLEAIESPDTPAEGADARRLVRVRVTPDGKVELRIPPHSRGGRKLRLAGKGLPGHPAGDLYAVLSIALPPADSAASQQAWHAFSAAFDGFNPRAGLEE